MADPSANFKPLSEIRSMGFMKLKKYVVSVGLDLPKHCTKPSLLKLIGKEKKYVEEEQKEDTTGASPSTIEVKKAASPRVSRSDSNAFNEDDFLKGNQGKANKACKRFRSHFVERQANTLIRPLQNAIFVYDMSADALTDALLNCEYEKLEEDFIMRIYHIMNNVVVGDWTNACGAEYEIEKGAEEKYKRFFQFVSIPQIRDRILALGELFFIRQQLNAHHRFTHNVHQALHEIIFDEEKVRYLIAVLLFTRAKATEQIHLDKMKIDWDVGGESNGIILLRMLMRRLPVTAQDLWLAERFDQIDESKPRIRKTGLGAIMQGHIEKQNQSDEQIKEVEEEAENAQPVVLDALMAELTSKTTPTAPLTFESTKPEPPKKLTQEDISKQNLKRLEFRVPMFKVVGTKTRLEMCQRMCTAASLTSPEAFIQELFLSYERLATTNDKLLDLWSQAESNYFQLLRTNFMKQIKDPEFVVLTHFVEDEWDLFLPDTVWGTIWEYRVPFEKNVDLRFALEAYREFMEKYGL